VSQFFSRVSENTFFFFFTPRLLTSLPSPYCNYKLLQFSFIHVKLSVFVQPRYGQKKDLFSRAVSPPQNALLFKSPD
jgi:hypothetical protein